MIEDKLQYPKKILKIYLKYKKSLIMIMYLFKIKLFNKTNSMMTLSLLLSCYFLKKKTKEGVLEYAFESLLLKEKAKKDHDQNENDLNLTD